MELAECIVPDHIRERNEHESEIIWADAIYLLIISNNGCARGLILSDGYGVYERLRTDEQALKNVVNLQDKRISLAVVTVKTSACLLFVAVSSVIVCRLTRKVLH